MVKGNDLGQVSLFDARSLVKHAPERRLQTQQCSQKGRLAAAVGAEQRNALAAENHGAEILDKRAVVSDRQALNLKHLVARAVCLGKPVFHFVLAADGLDALDALQALFHGKGALHDLFIAQAPALHALDGKAQALDFFVLPLFLLFQKLHHLVAAVDILAVVARVRRQAAVAHFKRARGDAV